MHRVRPRSLVGFAPALAAMLAAVLVMSACGGGDTAGAPDPESPSPAPAATGAPASPAPSPDAPPAAEVPASLSFTAATVGGGELDGAELAGMPVVFWFWAAWCSRCAAAASDVREVQAEYAGRVHMVGVAGLGSGEDAMSTFVDTHQLGAFPHLADDEGEVWLQFGVATREYFVILDDSGETVYEGLLQPADLRGQLDALVG